jgi:hypothetical protein
MSAAQHLDSAAQAMNNAALARADRIWSVAETLALAQLHATLALVKQGQPASVPDLACARCNLPFRLHSYTSHPYVPAAE